MESMNKLNVIWELGMGNIFIKLWTEIFVSNVYQGAHGQDTFPFTRTSRLALWPTQIPILWASEFLAAEEHSRPLTSTKRQA
jgi:hypothetical protein